MPAFVPRLAELPDVDSGSIADGDTLVFNEATGEFEGASGVDLGPLEAADTELSDRIDQEVADRTTAVTAESNRAKGAEVTAQATADAALPKSGGSLTGALTLAGDAGTNLQPVTKQQLTAAINALVNGAPEALDTLKEISDRLGLDEEAEAALIATVAGKLAKNSNLSDVVNAATALANIGGASLAKLEAEEAARKAADTAEEERAKTAEGLKLAKASNLSDLPSPSTARTSLGLGTAATQPTSAFDAAGAAATAQAAAEGFATTADGLLVPKSFLDTDSTMAANSDTKVATQKAVKSALALKAAASHTHAESDITGLLADLARLNWSYRDHGLSACSVLEPATLTTNMTPEAGKPIYTRVPVVLGEPNFATIRLIIGAAGTGATALANCFLRVYTSAGTGLGGSTDQAASWASAGEKGVACAADAEKSLKVPGSVGTYVWVGLLVGTQSTTAVQLAVTANSSGRVNFGMAAAGVPLRSAQLGSGKTALPTNITPSELTTSGVGVIGYGVV